MKNKKDTTRWTYYLRLCVLRSNKNNKRYPWC